MTDREIAERIAHDVAVESGMAHESLSALTAVIQEGIDRALAALREPDGMETTAEERGHWLNLYAEKSFDKENTPMLLRVLRDLDRLLAREAKAREEWEAIVRIAKTFITNMGTAQKDFDAAIRARTAPDLQSEIGLHAHLADLSARGLKP